MFNKTSKSVINKTYYFEGLSLRSKIIIEKIFDIPKKLKKQNANLKNNKIALFSFKRTCFGNNLYHTSDEETFVITVAINLKFRF